jgi:hypothetical protein
MKDNDLAGGEELSPRQNRKSVTVFRAAEARDVAATALPPSTANQCSRSTLFALPALGASEKSREENIREDARYSGSRSNIRASAHQDARRATRTEKSAHGYRH